MILETIYRVIVVRVILEDKLLRIVSANSSYYSYQNYPITIPNHLKFICETFLLQMFLGRINEFPFKNYNNILNYYIELHAINKKLIKTSFQKIRFSN